MPIEIKELVIRATIDSDKTATRDRSKRDSRDKQQINVLQRRIDQLQQMIKQKNER